jgi:hypothetical protein
MRDARSSEARIVLCAPPRPSTEMDYSQAPQGAFIQPSREGQRVGSLKADAAHSGWGARAPVAAPGVNCARPILRRGGMCLGP